MGTAVSSYFITEIDVQRRRCQLTYKVRALVLVGQVRIAIASFMGVRPRPWVYRSNLIDNE